MKRLLTFILALVMVISMIPAAYAAGKTAYTPGLVVEKASEKNLAGKYGAAYKAAGYQATFTYEADKDEDIAGIEVYGDFQWFNEEVAAQLAASGYKAKFHAISSFEYTDGLFYSGFSNPGGGDNNYPEGVRFYKSYLHYSLTKVTDGVYQLTMPMPAGLFRYQYRITDSEGSERAIADPANDWNYTIEEHTPTPATWSLVRIGTADEVSASEAYVYPIVDESKMGTIEKATVKTIIDTQQAIQVYLPYDYDANDPEPYKTLYVSHGGSENERTWMTMGALPNIMDNLIEEGAVDHTIVVTMDNNVALNVFDVTILSDNFNDYLIPYIEANYNVSKDAADRAYCGTSWGGITGLYIMAEHPEMMSAYGLFSVGFAYDLTKMFAETKDELKKHSIYLTVGNLESYAGPTVQSKYENLVELGLQDVTTYKKYNGSHDWNDWHAAVADFVRDLGWTDDSVKITEAGVYTASANVADGDVTAQITTKDGTPAFKNDTGVATAADGVVTIDASKITGINFNGTSGLYLGGTKIATYVIPELTVDNQLFGSACAASRSNLKPIATKNRVDYDENSKAVFTLNLEGLDNALIDSSKAKVFLDEGDGYYPEEYTFLATAVDAFENGSSTYTLKQGDLEINTYGYLIANEDTGRLWSCLGGDGQGNYYFNLTVDGITYNGLPVGSQTFRLRIYIYGNDYTGDANKLYGEGTVIEAVKGESGAAVAEEPVWTFKGENDIPVLCDYKADNFFVTWPTGTDASGITDEDVTVTLKGEYGDTKVLTKDDYTVFASSGETQIALTYINWEFTPVYTTMTISVNGAEKTYDIASVYVYEAQQGGGAGTGDGTVIVYSFYGLANQKDAFEIISPVTYTLSTNVDGAVRYYAEDANGKGILVDSKDDAKVFDGNGEKDRNVQLIENSYYITTRIGAKEVKTVDGKEYTFDKSYSGGAFLNPTQCDQSLEARPGYIIPWGTKNWITNEKWAWQSMVKEGWTGLGVAPANARFSWNVNQGATEQFTCSTEGVSWKLVGDLTSPYTTIDENGLLTVGRNETATFDVIAYIPGDIFAQDAVHVTPKAVANAVYAGDATAKCGEGETATIPVTYNNDAPASSVRLKIDTELPIKSIDSNYEHEFNPASNYVIIYTTGEFNKGDVLFTITFDLDVDPWLADGVYKVKLNIIDATDADVNDIELIGMPGYITIANEYAKGDINRDGSFDNADLIMIARYLVDLIEFDDQQMEIADFNSDGKVNNQDLVLIARALVAA